MWITISLMIDTICYERFIRILYSRTSTYAGNLSLSTFLLLLKVIGQINYLDDLLPELPISPFLMRRNEKKAQRIRHKILRNRMDL